MNTQKYYPASFCQKLVWLLLLCLLPACSAIAKINNREMVDPSLASRDYEAESGQLRLLLEASDSELPSKARPVALFFIPDSVMAAGGYRSYTFREPIDPQSELSKSIVAAAWQELKDDAGPCMLQEDGSLSGCTLVTGYMAAVIGTCTRIVMAYDASLTLPVSTNSEAEVITAIAILDQSSNGKVKRIQIIRP